jgi:hypothetical protein
MLEKATPPIAKAGTPAAILKNITKIKQKLKQNRYQKRNDTPPQKTQAQQQKRDYTYINKKHPPKKKCYIGNTTSKKALHK